MSIRRSRSTRSDRYQTPDSVLDGWPAEVEEFEDQIYKDFNEKHGTDYKFELKK